ncbi:cardiolipin synthase [Gammaproteobacteria bacterium]|nr:cardiolipin synthase [Gammaproteobacteria bacterium]
MFISLSYVLRIVSAVDAVMNTRTSQGAIAWGAVLITFPFIAVPAYWILGRSKFQGFAEAYEESQDVVEKFMDEARPKWEATFVDVQDRMPEYRALKNLTNLGMSEQNRATLLINGEATYDSILEGISKAKEYILVEFYIVRDDGIGTRLRDALLERVKAGVRVYFLFDEIGSKDLKKYATPLLEAGAETSPFNTTQGWRNRFQLNFRNHRKIVVVDGRSAWVGGLNVGDDYLGMYPELSPWRDTHMRIDGPAVIQVQITFLSDWFWATRRIPEMNWNGVPVKEGRVRAMVIPSGPTTELETATLFFTQALNSARERIWITSPYFVPDEGVMRALQLAALRGVDVRIILPNKADNPLVQAASYSYVQQLGGVDIKFFKFDNGFLHQKVQLIDQNISMVGTANFDNRSFRLNFELTVLVLDQAFATEVERMLEDDMAHSLPLDVEELKAQSFWYQAPRRIARLFAPAL